MNTRININGKIEEDPFISVFDHGFLFGDSVYEVINTRKNRPCFLQEHLKRLYRSAKGIDLTIPFDNSWFKEQIDKTLLANYHVTLKNNAGIIKWSKKLSNLLEKIISHTTVESSIVPFKDVLIYYKKKNKI